MVVHCFQKEMKAVMKSMRGKLGNVEKGMAHRADAFLFHHPYIGFAVATVGMPMLILLSVAVCTTAVMLPVSYVLG